MVRKGDLLFLYSGERAKYLLKYEPGKSFSSHLGTIEFPKRLRYGDELKTHRGRSFYVLRPRTSDLMMRVRRKTTIIYPKDAAYILQETGVRSGSKVIEVGTGSGSLTISLASIVGRYGKVYSFERRPEFLENATQNVERAGLSKRVRFFERDVESEGFGITGVDIVILDVPEPWKLVRHAWDALAGGGALASLSPNIEQIRETVDELRTGFVRIRCVELLEREILVRERGTRPKERMVSHTGYLLFASKVNDRIRHEVKDKKDARLRSSE
jgi:tRNA (adenine57-N1/adenine58-N1)-methyltransferase